MADLETLRREIEAIDDKLVAQLGQRFAVIRKVAAYKRERGIPAVLPDRIEAVKSRCAALAATHDLDDEFVRSLYDMIVGAACRLEEDIIQADNARADNA
jgi:chorismate mutase-like protein